MKRSNLWAPDGPIKRNRAENQHNQGQYNPYGDHRYAQDPYHRQLYLNNHQLPSPRRNGGIPPPPHMLPNQMGILGAGPSGGYHPPAAFPREYSPHPRRNGSRDFEGGGRAATPVRTPIPEVVVIGDSPDKKRDDDAYPKVTESIMNYVRTDGQSSELLDTKFRLRAQFEQQLRRLFSNCDLFIFGSSASGFGSKTSDMDMCLVTNNNIYVKDVKLLYRVKSILCSMHPLVDVQVINAKVPILKFVHQPTQIQCDLNINNSDGVRNTHLLKFFTKCDPRFVPLVLTLKRWARHHKINDASQGTLSSYALTLMALHYLQAGVKPPVLPNLIAENPDVFHPRRTLQSLSFHDAINGDFASRNRATVGELFIGFLTYYSKEFAFHCLGISVREARAVAKKTSKEFSKLIYIEEPYNCDNFEPYIKKVIDLSHSVICQSKELESVLTFNVDVNERAPAAAAPPKKLMEKVVDSKSSAAEDRKAEGPSSSASPAEEDETEPVKSEVSDLYEMAAKRYFTVTFDVVGESGLDHQKMYTTRCSVIQKKDKTESLISATGKAANKKLSKNASAKEMLLLLEQRKIAVTAKESFS